MVVEQQYIGEEMCEIWKLTVKASQRREIELLLGTWGITDCQSVRTREKPGSVVNAHVVKQIAVPMRLCQEVFDKLIERPDVIAIFR